MSKRILAVGALLVLVDAALIAAGVILYQDRPDDDLIATVCLTIGVFGLVHLVLDGAALRRDTRRRQASVASGSGSITGDSTTSDTTLG